MTEKIKIGNYVVEVEVYDSETFTTHSGEGLRAPSTSSLRPFLTVDRGENFHGNLDFDYYLVINGFFTGFDGEFVLWYEENGSQFDDDVPRLVSVAYHLNSTGKCNLADELGLHEVEVIALAMFYAHIKNFILLYDGVFDLDQSIVVSQEEKNFIYTDDKLPSKNFEKFANIVFESAIRNLDFPTSLNDNVTYIKPKRPRSYSEAASQAIKEINRDLVEKAFQKIEALSKTTIKHFNEVKENEWVVKPSIPILYFGDLNHYFNSKLKIITVALNPSNKEFPLEGKPRFSFCPAELSESDADKYMQTLSQYFERNEFHEPYDEWFNMQAERILNQLGSTYYPDKEFNNRALHTDLCSPIATDPTWDELKTSISPDDFKLLKRDGYKIRIKLMQILNLDILLISIDRKKYLKPNGFVEKYILRDNKGIETSFTNSDLLIRKNKKLPSLSSKNIILYEHKDLYKTKIYFGSKCSGIPFSNFAYSGGQDGDEDLIEIKKVASLIMDDFGFS